MSSFGAIVAKEMREYFATPIAPALLAVFWALSGYFFSFNLFFVNVAHMVTSFHNMSLLLMLVVPLLTMRVFAEENKSGTLELLLTLPCSEAAIVGAKFAAALLILVLMAAGTATAVIPLMLFGAPDLAPIAGGYLGMLLMGAAFIAIGVFVSSLTSNQLVAALMTWCVLIVLWFIDYAATLDVLPRFTRAVQNLSFSVHYVDLIRGVLNLGTVVYFASVVVFMLAATTLVLRWRRT